MSPSDDMNTAVTWGSYGKVSITPKWSLQAYLSRLGQHKLSEKFHLPKAMSLAELVLLANYHIPGRALINASNGLINAVFSGNRQRKRESSMGWNLVFSAMADPSVRGTRIGGMSHEARTYPSGGVDGGIYRFARKVCRYEPAVIRENEERSVANHVRNLIGHTGEKGECLLMTQSFYIDAPVAADILSTTPVLNQGKVNSSISLDTRIYTRRIRPNVPPREFKGQNYGVAFVTKIQGDPKYHAGILQLGTPTYSTLANSQELPSGGLYPNRLLR